MKIDLTTPEAAMSYLRSLPADQAVELPGSYNPLPNTPAADALEVISGESANAWACARSRWEWTVAELLAELGIEFQVTVQTYQSDSYARGVEFWSLSETLDRIRAVAARQAYAMAATLDEARSIDRDLEAYPWMESAALFPVPAIPAEAVQAIRRLSQLIDIEKHVMAGGCLMMEDGVMRIHSGVLK